MNSLTEKALQIKCLICDVDGVLTDGSLYIDNAGNELKAFNVQDGMGLKLLMASGIFVGIITTSVNQVIDHRMKQLGISLFYKGCVNKIQAFESLKQECNLKNEEIAYIGDDLPDLEIIKQVALGIAVGNAVPLVKEFADWTTEKTGGHGAVREVCDLILNAKGTMDKALQLYFNNECN